MPITGSKTFLNYTEIQDFIRDNDPEKNLLLDDLEFSPKEIEQAMTRTVDYWNEVPPPIGSYTYTRFPYRYHLLIGTTAQLLRSAAHRYRRNELPSQISGGSHSDQAKANPYEQIGDKLWSEYRAWVTQKKYQLNMEMGWGSI